jgi:hypothetical protein
MGWPTYLRETRNRGIQDVDRLLRIQGSFHAARRAAYSASGSNT